jgi:hypothetical protein
MQDFLVLKYIFLTSHYNVHYADIALFCYSVNYLMCDVKVFLTFTSPNMVLL